MYLPSLLLSARRNMGLVVLFLFLYSLYKYKSHMVLTNMERVDTSIPLADISSLARMPIQTPHQAEYNDSAKPVNVYPSNKQDIPIIDNIKKTEDVDLVYVPPPAANITTRGKPMNVSIELLKSLNIPIQEFVPLAEELLEKVVFATGASSDHFEQTRDAVASVQHHLPGHSILYYDMGLENHQVKEIQGWCDVTYRQYEFSKYPEHVSVLSIYSWKPLIVHELLLEFPAIMWVDSSIRLQSNFTPVTPHFQKNGYVMCENTGRGNYLTTHPTLYSYLPTNTDQQKVTPMFGGGSLLISRTRHAYKNFLYWAVLCALDPACINPEGATMYCKFDQNDPMAYAGCHRYDQSIFNILASNLHGYRYSEYGKTFVVAIREPSSLYQLRMCQ